MKRAFDREPFMQFGGDKGCGFFSLAKEKQKACAEWRTERTTALVDDTQILEGRFSGLDWKGNNHHRQPPTLVLISLLIVFHENRWRWLTQRSKKHARRDSSIKQN